MPWVSLLQPQQLSVYILQLQNQNDAFTLAGLIREFKNNNVIKENIP